uniref:Uncharacterized protein n=1 Tax=Anguilla anguilla TaxID=7936 RepID=A0A0E9U8Q9_ANGAN
MYGMGLATEDKHLTAHEV